MTACGLGIIVRIFCHFFHIVNFKLSFFPLSIQTMGISCECNASYSFVPIILKLCICIIHGMRMCVWFGYNC